MARENTVTQDRGKARRYIVRLSSAFPTGPVPNAHSNIRTVLVNTSHPGNIGAVARAMKNMCLADLWLVAPLRFPDAEATARASGADDLLARAKVCARLDEAIQRADGRQDLMFWGRALHRAGVIGLNERNAHFITALNPRRLYPRVDNKILTKSLSSEAGMAVPELYAVAETQGDVKRLPSVLAERESFVVKPANGSGGDGILVIDGRYGDQYRLISDELMS